MKRRTTLAAAVAWAGGVTAQGGAPGRPYRIGFLTEHDPARARIIIDTFLAQLRQRGFEPGRDFVLEVRYGERSPELIALRARELVALQPQLLVGAAGASAKALKQATRTIPIVGYAINNPVEEGLVESLARPGGNLTGGTFNQPEFAGKVVEVLKSAAPRIRRVTVIRNPDYQGMAQYIEHATKTAAELGLTLHYVEVRKTADLRLQDVERTMPDALYVVPEFAVGPRQAEIADFALAHKLPSIGTNRTYALAGGLLSLDTDPNDVVGVGADYVIRILVRGGNPATLPIQQPTRHRIVLNRKTADAIGIPLSQELMLRVNEVVG